MQGISAGMMPPPPLVSALTSAMCIGITVWTYMSNGSITAALAVASFAVLSLQLLAVEKPRFSQMTSSVFGLFYCGACGTPFLVISGLCSVLLRPIYHILSWACICVQVHREQDRGLLMSCTRMLFIVLAKAGQAVASFGVHGVHVLGEGAIPTSARSKQRSTTTPA